LEVKKVFLKIITISQTPLERAHTRDTLRHAVPDGELSTVMRVRGAVLYGTVYA